MISNSGTSTLGLYDFKRQIDAFGSVDYFRQNLVGGYLPNARVMLANGEIVQSTIDGNTNDPNVDMTGWVLVNSDGQIKTWSGRTQREKNKEVISLLDFNAPYSSDSTTHLQAALDYLSAKGGGVLKIPYHTGILRVDGRVDLRENVSVVCDDNLVIDCTANTSTYSFYATGSMSSGVNLAANVTSGAFQIITTSPHGLELGDMMMIMSQRVCAHDDAGNWRLGETTAGTNSPYFAEVQEVRTVTDATTFSIAHRLIFPDYRTDKTQETSPLARDCATIHKLDLLRGISWVGGIFKKLRWGVFQLEFCYRAYINAKFERGNDFGIEIVNRNCYASKIVAEVSRPSRWDMVADHSNYNSIKDISSWYAEVHLTEYNGCQGLDQTFTNVCGLFPRYYVRSFFNKEDGLTTHGCCYGSYIDAYVVSAGICAYRSRAPFTQGKIVSVNCARGLYTSAYGGVNSQFEVHAVGCATAGIEINTAGVTSTAPRKRNLRLSGYLHSRDYGGVGVHLRGYADADETLSGIQVNNITIDGFGRAIDVESGTHGVSFNNLIINNVSTNDSASPIRFTDSRNNRISNLYVDMSNKTTSTNAIALNTSASVKPDYQTCDIVNGYVVRNRTGSLQTATLTSTGSPVVHIVNGSDFTKVHNISVTANQTADGIRINLISIDPIPIGEVVYMYFSVPQGVTLANNTIAFYKGADWDTVITGAKTKLIGARSFSLTEPTTIRVTRVAEKVYCIDIP